MTEAEVRKLKDKYLKTNAGEWGDDTVAKLCDSWLAMREEIAGLKEAIIQMHKRNRGETK